MTETGLVGNDVRVTFARHGNNIPDVALDSVNSRIGNFHLSQRYTGYRFLDDVSADNIFQLSADANVNSLILFVCINHQANQVLLDHPLVVPQNLVSAYKVTGVELPVSDSYQALIEHMIQLHGDQFLLTGGFSAWQSARLQKQVERHYRTKSGLDEWFYHIPYGVTTLHPKVMDARPNHTLYGLDFNAMYASCFNQANYAHPGRLRYRKGDAQLKSKCLSGDVSGAFKCEIKRPSPWMQQHHLFAQAYGDISVRIQLPETFVAILHANEIAFWDQHAEIILIDGVCSEVLGSHPLIGLANKVYARRLAGNKVERKLAKQEMVLMHSCTAKSNKHHVKPDVAITQYGMNPEFAYTYADENNGVINLHKIQCQANVYSLQRQVLANARVKLLTQIQTISEQFPDAALCYANVDSLHYSVPNHFAEKFLHSLDIGEAMGQLKLEFKGEQGLWLDPGRWWIANDGQLIAYRSGGHYRTPNPRNMSLQHLFSELNQREWMSQPIQLADSDRFDVQLYLATIVHGNVAHTKRLWQQFSRYLYR